MGNIKLNKFKYIMKVFSIVALIATTSAIQLEQVQDPSGPVDPNFDPMYNRFRYGNTFVKGSSAQVAAQVDQVQDPSGPVDPNFDPMYNRFRYGNTFVKGSSMAQDQQV